MKIATLNSYIFASEPKNVHKNIDTIIFSVKSDTITDQYRKSLNTANFYVFFSAMFPGELTV